MSAPIICLTWNVCWGCMTNDVRDRTASGIARRCKHGLSEDSESESESESEEDAGESTLLCLDNVTSSIKDGHYSLIGLQEATNWEKIYAKISNVYNYINLKIEKSPDIWVDLITFYDNTRFTIVEIYFGNITHDGSDVRPYQIILFKDMDGKLFYFINLHNAHNVSKADLESFLAMGIKLPDLSKDKRNVNILLYARGNPALKDRMPQQVGQVYNFVFKVDDDDDMEWDETSGQVKLYFKQQEPAAKKRRVTSIPVIILGDFNDVRTYNPMTRLRGDKPDYWQGIMFNGVSVSLHSIASPPITCCAGGEEIRGEGEHDTAYGDYILNSDAISVVEPCQIVPGFNQNARAFPTSDHLPSTATFILPEAVSGGKKKRTYKKKKQKKRHTKRHIKRRK